MQASVKVTENGSFNVFNRSQEFRFTPEGFFRRKGRSKGSSKPDEEQLSFKVRILVVRRHHVMRVQNSLKTSSVSMRPYAFLRSILSKYADFR